MNNNHSYRISPNHDLSVISSDYQAKYIAHELDRVFANDDVAKLSGLLFDAQITPQPHQVDAALFALNTPFLRGVVLADEVGLGKTIEAGIVIMQYWAERKRDILIVAPSSLRQQWSQELLEKFNIPSVVVDSKYLKDHERAFNKNGIFICSYDFANRNVTRLSKGWDLMVVDEAHKLRNFYQNKQKSVARSISQIAQGTYKTLLLTATPLQNKLEELYGLISVVDPKYFYSLDVFKERYVKNANVTDLHDRIKKIAKRTLREQVKPYVSYTDRIARTVQFNPSGDEKKLYDLIDDYLHREKLYAFAKSQRHLSALILRKRLGSSTYATASTLHNIIERMEEELSSGTLRNNRGGRIAFDDLTYDEIEELENESELDSRNIPSGDEWLAFQKEIDELKSYEKLASSIQINVKAEKLTEAIRVGFEALQPGAARKAIIFTESTKTQEYLAEKLDREGFQGKYVLFNGSNNSSLANAIYHKWLNDNRDSDIITGVESSDRRKALIDKFKEDGIEIMIATEAAAEGINLQFCSMLINYDLPWNPQRVEQRIGRVHRMGQKYDVVVVNFNNQGNIAEQRILELLEQKYQLFKGTFGASNDVLGSIEDGLDFERRISDILNSCRSDDDIKLGFERLQEEYKDQIAKDQASTQSRIFDDLDPHVQDRFKSYQQQTQDAFNRFEQLFMSLTRYELRNKAAFEDDGRVFRLEQSISKVQQGIYYYKTDRVPHARQYKYISDLSDFVRDTAKKHDTPPAHLVFNIGSSVRASAGAKNLKGKQGILTVGEVTFPMSVKGAVDQSESYIVAAGRSNDGDDIDSETSLEILELATQSVEKCGVINVPNSIKKSLDSEISSLHEGVKKRNSALYFDKKDIIEQEFRDKEAEFQIKIDKFDSQIKEKERLEKQAPSPSERLEISKEIQKLRLKHRELRQEQFTLEDSRNEDIDQKLKLVEQALDGEPRMCELFTITWSIV